MSNLKEYQGYQGLPTNKCKEVLPWFIVHRLKTVPLRCTGAASATASVRQGKPVAQGVGTLLRLDDTKSNFSFSIPFFTNCLLFRGVDTCWCYIFGFILPIFHISVTYLDLGYGGIEVKWHGKSSWISVARSWWWQTHRDIASFPWVPSIQVCHTNPKSKWSKMVRKAPQHPLGKETRAGQLCTGYIWFYLLAISELRYTTMAPALLVSSPLGNSGVILVWIIGPPCPPPPTTLISTSTIQIRISSWTWSPFSLFFFNLGSKSPPFARYSRPMADLRCCSRYPRSGEIRNATSSPGSEGRCSSPW